uniref:Tocopherol cyclase n=1 Tax=Tetradesmus obliquus TaxID=3088 RepID=A0A383WJT5_TETOB|eukprot:jgi/Sobl393_1/5656/SZX67262.1
MLSRLNQAAIGSRLNPQSSKPKSPPWFEGWYTRVIGSEHSFGLVTGYFPEQNPKHPAFYTGLLFNEDSKLGKLTTFESYSDSSEGISISRGPEAEPNLLGATEAPDFCVEDAVGGVMKVAAGPDGSLLVQGNVQGAQLRIESLPGWQDTPWSEEGGSPQGLLHLLPGVGLHWYVHSTKTRVRYELTLPAEHGSSSSSGAGSDDSSAAEAGDATENSNGGSSSSSSSSSSSNGSSSSSSSSSVRVVRGEGWAHVEKNWGGSFPRSFVWSQGCSTKPDSSSAAGFDAEAQFCLSGGVLPTLNMDKLPVPLPNALLMGYRSKQRTWHFKPQSPTLFSTNIQPDQGLIIVTARQISTTLVPRTLILKIQANPKTFSKVGGPTRGGFVPHSVESYSAKATAECYEWGKLVEVTSFDRSALEFGGSYACDLAAGLGDESLSEGLVCEPQWEE